MSAKCQICHHRATVFYKDLVDDRYGAPGKFTIYRCVKCGFGRISPCLNKKEIGEFYAKYYPLSVATAESVKSSAEILPRWKSWLLGVDNIAHRYITSGAKVLDIGSASGVSLLEIQLLGGKAFGVEPDPGARKLAKELKLKVYIGQITDDPFPRQKFDFITASQVIEHVPDPSDFLRKIKNKLANNGTVILAFPNADALYRKIWGRRWLHWHVPYHHNFFTLDSIKYLAKSVGLKIKISRTITPNLWSLIQIQMLVSKNRVWQSQHKTNYQNKSHNLGKAVFRHLIFFFANILFTVLNRIIDSFGAGESFIVWLEKENNE